MSTIKQKLSDLPQKPGCYFFKDKTGKILYIGKANDIRKRVMSYFNKTHDDLKTPQLIKEIFNIQFLISKSEVEALLTESRLIKKHQPKYNLQLKAGERYAYIKVTDEKFPRLETSRDMSKKHKYFGPFASAATRKELIYICNSLFKLRVCPRLPKRACLLYHIKQCSAPCIGKISEDDYQSNIKKAELLIKGDTKKLISKLVKEMKRCSDNMQYELAKIRRDQLMALQNITEKQKIRLQKKYDQDVINYLKIPKNIIIQLFNVNRGVISGRKEFRFSQKGFSNKLNDFVTQYYLTADIPEEIIIPEQIEDQELIQKYLSKVKKKKITITIPKIGEKKNLLNIVKTNLLASAEQKDSALVDLQNKLSLPTLPRVIEAFDVSNLGANQVVGSMVHFADGMSDKNNYRRFKIKTFEGQSDFDAMREIVYRRYYRLKKERAKYPDLILVDGGKAQLTAATSALIELGIQIPTIAIAKRLEEIYTTNRQNSVHLPRSSDSLRLIQKIRDEAHRFAIKYHRLLRSKHM
ncbi:excinuclease ABC subunit UvrC [Patescibacteria group bacterium]|nr:excinuclease ABC subunit UvrC [Patescibacteria group bacterium]